VSTSPALNVLRCLALGCLACAWSAAPAATGPFIRAADHAAASLKPSTPFNWGEGVLTWGLVEASRATKDARYREAVERWADAHCAKSLLPLLRKRGYCGHWGPGTALLALYRQNPRPVYLGGATEIRAFIGGEATRTKERALGHWRGNVQIWVDTLCMVCPTLASYAACVGERAALDDAILQLEIATKHLQDEKTGLFWHMWDEKTGKHSEGLWGRGNGWVILSLVETLAVLPGPHARADRLRPVLQAQVRGLLACQRPSGMWRTVLDRDDAYEETSATAMIVYGIAKAAQRGLIEGDHTEALRRAWAALERQVDEKGMVQGTSAGTGPRGIEHYLGRPQGEYAWGTGAFLLAGAKLREMGLIPPK